MVALNDKARCAGGADDNVHGGQGVGYLLEADGLASVSFGQFQAAFEGAVGHGDVTGPVADQMFHGQFGHLPGPDQ